jgi:hypothetical protein
MQLHMQSDISEHCSSIRQWLKDVKRGKIMKKATAKMACNNACQSETSMLQSNDKQSEAMANMHASTE